MDSNCAVSVTSPAAVETAPASTAQPRLGIAHLMIWTAGAAVCLAVQRLVTGWGGPGEFPGFVLVLALSHALFHGMLVGSLAVGATRLARGVPVLVHPGQWLAILWGTTTIAGWPVIAFYQATASQSTSWTYGILYAAHTLINGLFAAGCGVAVIHGKFGRRWNAVLAAVAIEEVLAAASSLALFGMTLSSSSLSSSPLIWVLAGTFISALSAFILLPLMFAAALGDRRRGVSRDWMHWIGALGIVWKTGAAWMLLIGNLIVIVLAR